MQVFQNLSEISKDNNTVITLGTFDGVHLGHKNILENVLLDAKRLGGRSFLITFDPHPRSVIHKETDLKLLTTLREKTLFLETIGIDNLLVISFTKELSQFTAERFLKEFIIDKIGLKEIIVGYDHHFGKGRGGDVNTLRDFGKEFGFDVKTIDAVSINGENISSSKIRQALNNGDLNKANSYLGRFYTFSGRVIRGDKRGRELGFPTANLKIDAENKLLPALGIYAVEVVLDAQKFYGLLSIGKRPTFYESGNTVAEVYIFDFNQDIYDKNITLNLIERIRGEEKFSSPDKLISQMNKDKEIGLEILSKLTN